jgi:hypothetical protein
MTVTLIMATEGRAPRRDFAAVGRQAVGPDHFHVEARHAPRDAVEDVGFAFPDKEVEFVEVGSAHRDRFNKPVVRRPGT